MFGNETSVRFGRCFLLFDQPEQYWSSDVNRAVGTDDNPNKQREGEAMNAFTTEDVEEQNANDRGSRRQQRTCQGLVHAQVNHRRS